MYQLLKKCVFLFLAAVPVFSQTKAAADREQGLITAEPSWRQALGGSVLSLPDVQVQSAVVALDGGNIKAYSTAGRPMWNYSAKGKISPFVTRSREGTSYFSRTNGILIAVNRAGRELWQRNLGSPLCGRVITGWDGRLFVPAEKKIFCYTASGNLLWTRTFESPFYLAPKPDRNGGIILALENNEACRIDPFGNVYKLTLSKKPVVLLSAGEQRIIALYTDGNMEMLEAFENWFISAQSGVSSTPLPKLPQGPIAAAGSGNNIAAVLTDGRIAFVSLEEKKVLWNGDSHIREFIKNGGKAEPEAEILFDERGIYVLSRNGATGFSHDGRRLWYTFLQNTAAIPAFGNDGVLYSGGKDWILYAYKIEDRILSEKRTLYGPAPDGSYGTDSPKSSYMPDFPFFEYEIKTKLEQIISAVNAGSVGENELAWTTFLMMTSDSQASIQYRVGALRMLGKIGSRETIPWLINIFRKENDPSTKAAAVAAIGDIGVDPDGAAINLFFNAVNYTGGLQNAQVLTSIAAATGALCRFSGPPLSETGIKILTLLSTDSQPPIVSRQAKKELASLRK